MPATSTASCGSTPCAVAIPSAAWGIVRQWLHPYGAWSGVGEQHRPGRGAQQDPGRGGRRDAGAGDREQLACHAGAVDLVHQREDEGARGDAERRDLTQRVLQRGG